MRGRMDKIVIFNIAWKNASDMQNWSCKKWIVLLAGGNVWIFAEVSVRGI